MIATYSDSAAVRRAIDANLARFAAAFKRGDANALRALYADDAVQLNPNLPAWEGAEAIRQGFTGFFHTMTVSEASFTTRDVLISGTMAVERGNYALRLVPRDGGPEVSDRGKYLTVWMRQQDGSWKIVRDISNPDPPAPR